MPVAHLLRHGDVSPSLDHVVRTFEEHASVLAGDHLRTVPAVLHVVRHDLRTAGFVVADGRRSTGGVPVAIAPEGTVNVDALHRDHGVAVWVETGRSWTNNAFLEHAVLAACAPAIDEVVIAVRNTYSGQPAYSKCRAFLDTVLRSERLTFPYRALTLIGY